MGSSIKSSDPGVQWFQEQEINGEEVQFALVVGEEGEQLQVTMGDPRPDGFWHTWFTSTVNTKEDIAEVLLMVLQFACHGRPDS